MGQHIEDMDKIMELNIELKGLIVVAILAAWEKYPELSFGSLIQRAIAFPDHCSDAETLYRLCKTYGLDEKELMAKVGLPTEEEVHEVI
jgi:hypothetical protein